MLVVGHDHGNMAVGSIVLSVVPIGKLIGTRKSEFAGTPPLSLLGVNFGRSAALLVLLLVRPYLGTQISDATSSLQL